MYYDTSAKIYKIIGKNWIDKPGDGWVFFDIFAVLQGDTLICSSGYYGHGNTSKAVKIK